MRDCGFGVRERSFVCTPLRGCLRGYPSCWRGLQSTPTVDTGGCGSGRYAGNRYGHASSVSAGSRVNGPHAPDVHTKAG